LVSAASEVHGEKLLGAATVGSQTPKHWQSVFPVDRKALGVKGSNAYFNLTPNYQLSFQHGGDADTLTVLDEIKLIDGIQTRVVEDRETTRGQVVELTRDYYAIDSATGDVYCFGEDVDVYKNGKVTGHKGAWLSGANGAKFGLSCIPPPLPGCGLWPKAWCV
jgi:hypothetical protein